MKIAALILMALAVAWAAEPRKSAKEYPAHVELPTVDIGVDYMVHSYSDEGQMYFTKDYLVFDVAIYPKGALELTGGSFELRINNSKQPLRQASAEFVAASVKYPGWTEHPHAEAGAGVGDVGVVLGAPPAVGRFPGDPAGASRYPKPPRAPDDPHKPEKAVKDEGQIAVDNALKAGRITAPVSGNVYFEYSGNMKKVKTLGLIFHTATVDLDIPIR
jgi:hypothetical protein